MKGVAAHGYLRTVLREHSNCLAIALTLSPLRAITRISTACSWVSIGSPEKAAIVTQVGQIYFGANSLDSSSLTWPVSVPQTSKDCQRWALPGGRPGKGGNAGRNREPGAGRGNAIAAQGTGLCIPDDRRYHGAPMCSSRISANPQWPSRIERSCTANGSRHPT